MKRAAACTVELPVPEAKEARSEPDAKEAMFEPVECAVPEPVLAGDEFESPVKPFPEKSRHLHRNSTEVQVERIVADRLKAFDPIEMATATGKSTGMSVNDYIGQEVRQKKAKNGRLCSNFWHRFHEEFKLGTGKFTHMDSADDPAGEEALSDELLDAVGEAHKENPAARKAEPFVNFLEYAGEPSVTELRFMIEASREGPVITKKNSHRMLVAILAHIGRTKSHERFVHFWRAVKADFDKTFAAYAGALVGDARLRREFVRGNAHALAPLVDMALVSAMEDATARGVSPDGGMLQLVLATAVGATLYQAEGARLQYDQFLGRIADRIGQLEYHDFRSEEVRSFRALMQVEAREVSKGAPRFAKKTGTLDFLGEDMQMAILSVNDEWSFRLAARVKAVAVSRGQLPRLPWEVVVFGDRDPLPGFPETVKVPDDLIEPYTNVRAAAKKLLDGYEGLTFADMRRFVAAQADILTGMDRHFAIELQFLRVHAEEVAERGVRSKLLAMLPRDGSVEGMTMATASAQVEALSLDRRVAACHPNLAKEIRTTAQLLRNLMDCEAPSDENVLKMAPFFRQVLARCEHFLTAEVRVQKLGTLDFTNTRVSGRAAMAALWQAFAGKDENDRCLADVEEFRRFKWMLPRGQCEVVSGVITKGIRSYQERFSVGLSICDTQEEGRPAEAGHSRSNDKPGAASSSMAGAETRLAKKIIAQGQKKNKDDVAAGNAAEARSQEKKRLLALFRK